MMMMMIYKNKKYVYTRCMVPIVQALFSLELSHTDIDIVREEY
jgi:hypothetical protein